MRSNLPGFHSSSASMMKAPCGSPSVKLSPVIRRSRCGCFMFHRRGRSCTIVPATAAHDLKIGEGKSSVFLKQLTALGLVEPADHMPGQPETDRPPDSRRKALLRITRCKLANRNSNESPQRSALGLLLSPQRRHRNRRAERLISALF